MGLAEIIQTGILPVLFCPQLALLSFWGAKIIPQFWRACQGFLRKNNSTFPLIVRSPFLWYNRVVVMGPATGRRNAGDNDSHSRLGIVPIPARLIKLMRVRRFGVRFSICSILSTFSAAAPVQKLKCKNLMVRVRPL